MTQRHTDHLKEQILEFLSKHPNEQFKPQEIARRLSVREEDEYRMLQSLLP